MWDNAKLAPLSMEQAIVLTVCTGVALAPVKEVIKDVSYRLGRPVDVKEFTSQEFVRELQALYHSDFLKLMVESPLILPEQKKLVVIGDAS